MTRTAMSLPGLPILVPRTDGSALPLSSTGSCERRCRGSNLSSRDFVCKTECHSTSERGSRGEDETAVPCSTDPWSQPPNRTYLSTSFKIHSGVYSIYPKSTQRAWGSDEQRPTSGIRKGESTDDVPMRPFQLPYLYQRFFFFLRTHPLEVRWSWNWLRPVTSVVPREENTADKEIGPAGPQTIPSP